MLAGLLSAVEEASPRMKQGGTDRVAVEVADGVAEVRLNRPDKLNALDPDMFAALVAAGERLIGDPEVRAVVLSGEGRAFCAGLDMASFAAVLSGGGLGGLGSDLTARTHGPANLVQEVVLIWRRVPVPVIAALHGSVLGGGFQIALGADIRYAAPDAKLSVMEIRWGIVPDMGGTFLLRELAATDVIRELTFTGRVVSGEEAARLGLVTRVLDDPRAAALAIASEIAGKSPDAVRAAKRLLNLTDQTFFERVLVAESAEQSQLLGSPNQVEAVRANMEKRAPAFRAPRSA